MINDHPTTSGGNIEDANQAFDSSSNNIEVLDRSSRSPNLEASEDKASWSNQFKARVSTKQPPGTSDKHKHKGQASENHAIASTSTSSQAPSISEPKRKATTHQARSQRPESTTHSSASKSSNMSKLSPALKQLINAPFSKPSTTTPNLSTLQPVINKIISSAQSHNVGLPAWLTFTTATAMTMNSPTTLTALYQAATSTLSDSNSQKQSQSEPSQQQSKSPTNPLTPLTTAELQREVSLKCISFNGIPRTINCLGAYHSSLPSSIRTQLSTKPTRDFTPNTLAPRKSDGLDLWNSVYAGFETKLLSKLSQSHPDLPVHILNSHYSNLLSNPTRPTYLDGSEGRPRESQVGRVLTSIVAISCLRAQTGVGPQVVSHVFGLRKAYENGEADSPEEVEVQGGKWLSTEEGGVWLLERIDELVAAIGTGQEGEGQGGGEGRGTFAPGYKNEPLKAKL